MDWLTPQLATLIAALVALVAWGIDEEGPVDRARLAAAGALVAVDDRLGRTIDVGEAFQDAGSDPNGSVAEHHAARGGPGH